MAKLSIILLLLFGYSHKVEIVSRSRFINLSNKQVLSSVFMEFNEQKNVLVRIIDFPKSGVELFDLVTGNHIKSIFPEVSAIASAKQISEGGFIGYDPNRNELFFMDDAGVVFKRINLAARTDLNTGKMSIIPGRSAFTPIIYFNSRVFAVGNIYLSPSLNVESKRFRNSGVVLEVDSNGNKSYRGFLPDKGYNNFYGWSMNAFSMTQNGDKLILCPFYSSEIQVIDINRKNVKLYNLKSDFDLQIPLSKLKDRENISLAKGDEYFNSNFSAIGIVYDRYRDVYYRFIRHPYSPNRIKCSLIVLDKNFKTISKTEIPSDYDPARFFVDKEGLHIANLKLYNENPSKVYFDLFKLVKI